MACERLTEAQREVLRLVAQGRESKEIGLELGISHHSVNRRIERAVQVLGARNRRDAARQLAAAEGSAYDPLAREPIHLSETIDPAELGTSDQLSGQGFPWPFATPSRNDGLSLQARLFWALIGLPVIIMIAWGLLLAGIAALDTLKL